LATIDFPMDARLRSIEDRLGAIERDMAIIKTRLEALPSRWMQVVALLALLLPIYSIMAALLIQVSK